jgi:general secretion pathway protein K
MNDRRLRSSGRRHPAPGPTGPQRGVALLTVLLVTALASIIAVGMISRQHLSIAQTRQVVYADQALHYALGAESRVRGLLTRDRLEETAPRPVDGIGDRWAQPESPFELEQGSLSIRVRDLGGLLNLNATTDAASVDRLERLFTFIGVDPNLAGAIADWVDEDDTPTGAGGAEDGRYLLEDPPYRAANGPFASVTELRLLPEVDAEMLARLVPYVSALPVASRRVNVNTAPAEVLASLAPGSDLQRIAALARPETPRSDPSELIAEEPAFVPESGMLAVHSRFFEILVRADHGGRSITLRSMVYRDAETGETTVFGRDLGRHFETWARPPDPETDPRDLSGREAG